jgi:N-acetylneuraminic acid mutarotase
MPPAPMPTPEQTLAPTPTPSPLEAATEEPATGPPALGYHSMTTLGSGRGVLLYAGETGPRPDAVVYDTWTFSEAAGWTQAAGEAPGVWGDDIAYDSASDRVLLLASLRGFTRIMPMETWAYDPAADEWTQMEPDAAPRPSRPRLAFDDESGRLVSFERETWSYDFGSGQWMQMGAELSPPGRMFHNMVYHEGADRTIVFGGWAVGNRLFADTWAYDYNSDTWAELMPPMSPPAREYSAMAYDPVTDRIILFGGAGPGEAALGDTWAYDYGSNTWTELSPAVAPSARGWHAMAYSDIDQKIVLFGGGADRDSFQPDTWLFDPATDTWALVP